MNTLKPEDFRRAADAIGCQVAAIQAVCEVEAPGGGFNPDGSLKVLFEGHHFHRLTKGKFTATNPTLSYPKWTREFYGKGQTAEWDRLKKATALDPLAAILSTSWGRFQVMGFNHNHCGFMDAADMVQSFRMGEAEQLAGFVAFVKFNGLDDELRTKNWAGFAKGYNGPGYAANRYDVKIADQFARFGGK